MNKTDKIMATMLVLFAASVISAMFMWNPMHHLGIGFIWLVFIVVVVLLVSDDGKKRGRKR